MRTSRLSPEQYSPLPVTLACLAALLTSACVSHQRTQEPARYPTKRGQQPYTVNGTRYEPLSSHIGFEQEGVASSYGSDFHGRATSSGEIFDMHAMTAAHKTLPLGVFVRVRDKRSGREIVVRINDRGPFVQDRIIDLSEAAAEKLGILRVGLAPVKITALGYRSEDSSGKTFYHSPESYDRGTFALQVGAFAQKPNATRLADELRRKYGTADVREALISGVKYYRVRLGRYTSLKAAQDGQDRFQHGLFPGCFVVAVD